MISEREEEFEESVEIPRSGCDYITPGVSPEVRSRASSPERVVNIDSSSIETSTQEGTPPLNYSSDNPDTNSMVGHDIWLPTFNGNGAGDSSNNWFLCEAVWMVHLVHNTDLKKVQMITNLRGHALDWFIKFYVVPLGRPQKTLE